MKIVCLDSTSEQSIADLFDAVFTLSEGEGEGRLLRSLATELARAIDQQDVHCFACQQDELVIACIFFTALRFTDSEPVYMLAPVAVATAQQGKGVGQALIRHGLQSLRQQGIRVVVTYGDPAFYGKLGFASLSEQVIRAPLTMSMPEGWLGLSLAGDPIQARKQRPRCVPAFAHPVYW